MMLRIFPVILLMLVFVSLHAQPRDYFLTHTETAVDTLRSDIRIEAAGRVGTRVLAVWGTNAAESGGIRPILVGQIVEGGKPVSNISLITDSAARPSGVVAVEAMNNRFLILWNDARDSATAIYMRVVDPLGGTIGEPLLLGYGALSSSEGIYLFATEGGYSLIWNGTRLSGGGIYRRTIDRDGKPIDANQFLFSGATNTIISPAAFPGMRLIKLKSGAYAMIHADGGIDSRVIPATIFGAPHYLNADTSIISLGWKDSGRIELDFYRSMFDSTSIERKTPIGTQSYISHVGAVGKDSTGNLHAWYFDVGIHHLSQGDGYSVELQHRVITGNSITIDSTFRAVAGTTIYSGNPIFEDDFFLLDDEERFGCDNSTSFSVRIRRDHWVIPYNSVSTEYFPGDAIVNGSGDLVTSTPTDFTDLYGLFPETCSTNGGVRVARISSSRTSAVNVRAGNARTKVETGVPPDRTNRTGFQPNILLSDDTLYLAWDQLSVLPRYSVAIVDYPAHDSTRRQADLAPAGTGETYAYKKAHYFASSIAHHANASAVLYSTSDEVHEQSTDKIYFRGDYTVYVAIHGIWRGIESGGYTNAHFQLPGCWFDPNTRGYAGVVVESDGLNPNSPPSGRIAFSSDSVGEGLSSVILDALSFGDALPIGPGEFLVLSGIIVQHVLGRKIIADYSITNIMHAAAHERLLGGEFIRVYYDTLLDASGRESHPALTAELFGLKSTDTRPRRSVRIDSLAMPDGFFIAQRATDFAIFIGWGSSNGLHLMAFDRELNLRMTDTVVSVTHDTVHSARGVFRHDTLFVVWEDHRNGLADIYGTFVAPPPFPGPADTAGNAPVDSTGNPGNAPGHGVDVAHPRLREPDMSSSLMIIPNPADAVVEIRFLLPNAGVITLDIIDAAGKRVKEIISGEYPAGANYLRFDPRVLHPGAYIVLLHAAGHDSKGRLVVLH